MVTQFLSYLCYFYVLDCPFACTLCKDCNSAVKQACEHARYEVHCQTRYFVYYCVWSIISGACFLYISCFYSFVLFLYYQKWNDLSSLRLNPDGNAYWDSKRDIFVRRLRRKRNCSISPFVGNSEAWWYSSPYPRPSLLLGLIARAGTHTVHFEWT